MRQPRVIYEDNHLLVVDKPCGLPTSGVVDRPSLLDWGRDYLKQKYDKPGNVYLGVVSRLDTVTSGVLVLARTSKAAGRLADQLRSRQIRKEYLAIVRGEITEPHGHLVDEVYKDDAAHRMRIDHGGRQPRSQTAELRFQTLARSTWHDEALSLLRVELVTGRKHQIRVQLADRGWTIWGDRKYGDRGDALAGGIALHAWRLRFKHPTRPETLRFRVDPPVAWARFRLPPVDALTRSDD